MPVQGFFGHTWSCVSFVAWGRVSWHAFVSPEERDVGLWYKCTILISETLHSVQGSHFSNLHQEQVWAGLQDLVDHVKQPMWLRGKCGDPMHIVLRRQKETPGSMSPPEEEWEIMFGPVRVVLATSKVHDVLLAIQKHHLGDIIWPNGQSTYTKWQLQHRGVTEGVARDYRACVQQH
mmetsp:Transcript_64960/g.115607  ORF Transcript_64960/g.115607 Transcript_64960/m.115607 type:complete len:177 (-) Transcript_64960:345-875(-)